MQITRDDYPFSISGLPQNPPIDSAMNRGLFICWWEREVNVWKMSRSKHEKKHRLMARIALKGEENVSCAALSASGELLAVVTAAKFKVFKLSPDQRANREVLSVQKIFSARNASGRMLKFSPDDNWLAIVTHANTVKMIDIRNLIEHEEFKGARELRRVHRESHTNGSLGEYTRTINRIEFSPDSNLLVASDISGYLDSWILSNARNGVTINGKDGSADSESNSDSSDSEASEIEVPFDGMIWKSNPVTQQTPKLNHPPIVLSFRQCSPNESGTEQYTPQPQGKYELLVVTAQHHLFEVDLLSGSFTDWSRRNPTSSLPERFSRMRDRAMGSFWGTNGWWWLYGSTWLFGIDVTVDHKGPAEEEKNDSLVISQSGKRGKKRKRGDAGGIKEKDIEGLVAPDEPESDTHIKINILDSSDKMDIDIHDNKNDDDDDDDDEAASGSTLVAALRGGDVKHRDQVKEEKEDKPTWFLAMKYRPILGVVPIKKDEGKPVEVVLVERPIWDLTLPPRFEKVHDR
jgi:U3 small nucleolar RNA-associated protein 4